MKKNLIFISIFILCLFSFPLSAEQSDHSELDVAVRTAAENFFKQDGTVSLMIGISRNGENRVFRFAKPGSGFAEPDETGIFEIGSITKTFTGIIIQDLIREGKLKLSTPLNDFLPETCRLSPVNKKEILVKHLLSHTSGLPRMPSNHLETVKDYRQPYENYSMDHLTAFLKIYKPENEPGSSYLYSNLGYALLGWIIEKVTGESYEKVIDRVVFKKLKMNRSFIEGTEEFRSGMVQGYLWGQAVPPWHFGIVNAAGAIKSDIRDMLIYLNTNMNAGPENGFADFYRSHQPLFHDEKTKMDVGLAWHIVYFGEEGNRDHMVWHNGGTGGFRSFMGFVRSSRTGVVVLSNSVIDVDSVGIGIMKHLNNR